VLSREEGASRSAGRNWGRNHEAATLGDRCVARIAHAAGRGLRRGKRRKSELHAYALAKPDTKPHFFAAAACPANDIVALNAGAALYVAGVADSIADGLARARAGIADGSACAATDG